MELYLSIFAAIVSIASFLFSLITYYFDVINTRYQATLNAYDRLQNQALDKLNTYSKKQITEISYDPKALEYKEISALLARCEHFAVGVNEKVYDMKTLRRLAKPYFIGVYDKLTPMIDKKRTINKSEMHYIELETMVEKLKKTK